MQVLVYGAGQLAQMLYLAGVPMGIHCLAVDVGTRDIVHPVSKDVMPVSYTQALADADVVTVEFEHVPDLLLAEAEASGKLKPNYPSIAIGADRVKEKNLLSRLDIANCQYEIITDVAQLTGICQRLGERIILKASRDGYDGYGQWRIKEPADITALQTELAELDLHKVPLVAEVMVDFERELSILGARKENGEMVFYPLAENLHYQGQLHVSVAPAQNVNSDLQAQAEAYFRKIADHLDFVGLLAVELFQVGDQLLVNELAPRVHNSGHWSMVGCDASQFANHLRAICDLPLGDTHARKVHAMLNVIAFDKPDKRLLATPEVNLHWYDKGYRPKRKMGHINLSAANYTELGQRIDSLRAYLPHSAFPCLAATAKKLQA